MGFGCVYFPAVADIAATNALINSAGAHKRHCVQGIVVTQGVFYSGVMPTNTAQHAASGAVALEMELAEFYTAASLHNVQAGAILAVDGNALAVLECAEASDPDHDLLINALNDGISIALDALVQL